MLAYRFLHGGRQLHLGGSGARPQIRCHLENLGGVAPRGARGGIGQVEWQRSGKPAGGEFGGCLRPFGGSGGLCIPDGCPRRLLGLCHHCFDLCHDPRPLRFAGGDRRLDLGPDRGAGGRRLRGRFVFLSKQQTEVVLRIAVLAERLEAE